MNSSFSDEIKKYARSIGFDVCGISRAGHTGEQDQYAEWLLKGCHADMGYLERNIEKRLDPRLLVEGAKSIISVAINYYPDQRLPDNVPQFAYYTYGDDYHDVVREKLHRLFEFIKMHFPDVTGRCFTDSAPVLERYWAAKAGLGFIGKNTLLILPKHGSFFFLGEIILDLTLDYDTPITLNCGSCRKCIDACPTGAIKKPHWLNANKCISYQTIENKGDIDEEIIPNLSNNVYGCDICQKVCPWNRFAKPCVTPEFKPSDTFLSLDRKKLGEMDEENYRLLFRKSAVKRAKFNGLKRNIECLLRQ